MEMEKGSHIHTFIFIQNKSGGNKKRNETET